MRILKLPVLVLLFMASTGVMALDSDEMDELQAPKLNEWRLTKNDKIHKIKTYYRLEAGRPYRSFKVEAELDGQPEALARVFLDFDNYTKWFWQTRESKLVKQVSATEYIVYMIHRAPFGLPDRDTVLRAVYEPQTKSKEYAILRATSDPDFLPLYPPMVRMPGEEINIRFHPLPGDRVGMVAEGYFNPGGGVPAWSANVLQRSIPYSIVLGLQRMISQDKYTKAQTPLPFPIFRYSDYAKDS
ncbi:MAG: hypothetical protein Q7T36_11810 [Fluviicoccus sp.]|uniref:hypothetical protein n=1 Tax=Fluviicoccus sp. TaxID=2003552 RepID=UPI00271A26A2|nr:hypothetical protein [Fluviicoccus sp.]MDO8331145.1 hypothetical protein [Fluviicoccus sp.]